ncbi:MAG: hypothetical protein ACJASI_002128, partial [Glaciecola sp.]
TKTVNQTKFGCTQTVNATDTNTIKPANAVNALSADITPPK